jgi:hypothetical protein
MNVRRLAPWLIAAALCAGRASAQEAGPLPTIPADGTDVFAYLLKARGFTPVPSIAHLQNLAAPETVVIILGRPDALQNLRRVVGSLRLFQERGGNVLLATDHPTALADWLLTVANDTVQQDPASAYRHNPECPVIGTLEPTRPAAFHKLPKGLATNRPSYFLEPAPLIAARRWLEPLAVFPSGCHAARSGQRLGLGLQERAAVYILLAPEGKGVAGRAVLMAGHGLFTNAMLLQTDNDNFEFALACLRWLGEGEGGQPRRHALLVVDGEVIPSFDNALKPPPPPGVPPIPVPTIQLVNRLLHGLEREGFFFQVLRDNVNVHRFAQWAVAGLTVLLLLYGAKKLGEQRHHAEAGSVLLVGPFAAPAESSPLLAQRHRSQLERDAFLEQAVALARQWFLEACGIGPADWDRAPRDAREATAGPPAAELAGGWLERFRMRRRLDRVWDLACRRTAGSAVRFTWGELVRLTGTLQELRRAIHEGRLRFAGCSADEFS